MVGTFQFNDLAPSAPTLANLQCNILRSSGRPRSTQVFRRFTNGQELVDWLRGAAPSPTPAGTRDEEQRHERLVNLLFSAEALEWLGISLEGADEAFKRGARHKNTLKRLGEDGVGGWGPHQQGWHVAELHAHDPENPPEVAKSKDYLIEHGSGVRANGEWTEDRDEPSHGHFKILDGITRSVYTEEDYQKVVRENRGAPVKWDPRHPLSNLLVRDFATDAPDAFGSYFVFRKLEQNVGEFERRLEEIGEQIAQRREKRTDLRGILTPEDRGSERFRGKTCAELREQILLSIIGRTAAGKTADGESGSDFDFASDPGGDKCPFHAHIRKVNPRGDTGNLQNERRRRVARRGISYHRTEEYMNGELHRAFDDKGLLFWCAQASIKDQFEYMQRSWANATDPSLDDQPTPHVDSLIGRLDPRLRAEKHPASHWARWTDTSDLDFSVWTAVTLRGAEYFYAPSISAVQALKSGIPEGAVP